MKRVCYIVLRGRGKSKSFFLRGQDDAAEERQREKKQKNRADSKRKMKEVVEKSIDLNGE